MHWKNVCSNTLYPNILPHIFPIACCMVMCHLLLGQATDSQLEAALSTPSGSGPTDPPPVTPSTFVTFTPTSPGEAVEPRVEPKAPEAEALAEQKTSEDKD